MPDTEFSLGSILSRVAAAPEDSQGWWDLCSRTWPYVVTVNYRLFRGISHLAENASYEVFQRLARYAPIETLTDELVFYQYLRTMCRNVFEDQKMNLERQQTVQASALSEHAGGDLLGKQTEPEKALDATLKRMAAEDARLVGLMLDGYTLGEIDRQPGFSPAAERLHQVRNKIRKMLPSS
jgi:uncharacterized protein YcfJ